MKKWQRFVTNVNVEEEKRLLHDLKLERTAIKELESILRYDIGVERIEPKLEKVSYGALYRCCICLESIVALINAGYIGSVYALFRQVYELLAWSKLAVDLEDVQQLEKLHDNFYIFDQNQRYDGLNYYFRRISYEIEDDSVDEHVIRKAGRDYYTEHSNTTHGSSYAQQCPLPSDDFYSRIDAALKETAFWIGCLVEVFNSYIYKCITYSYKACRTEDFGEMLFSHEGKQALFANHLIEFVNLQIIRMKKINDKIDDEILYKTFAHTKWRLV